MSRYSGRYVGRVDTDYLEAPQFLGKTAVTGTDSHHPTVVTGPGPAPRRSQQQLVALGERLSDRDRQILDLLREYRLATTDQIQRQLFIGHVNSESARRVTRRVLNRLEDHHLLYRLGRRIGGIRSGSSGMVWSLTRHGHRLLGASHHKRLKDPSITHIRHVLAITELATDLTDHCRTLGLDLTIETEPDCWRKTADHLPPLKPDLHLKLADDDTELVWFVEVDRGTESGTVITAKLDRYQQCWQSGIEQNRHGVFPKIAWIAPDAARAQFIDDQIAHGSVNPALFVTTTAEAAIELLSDLTEPESQPDGQQT